MGNKTNIDLIYHGYAHYMTYTREIGENEIDRIVKEYADQFIIKSDDDIILELNPFNLK